jgi:hypothetical protein
MVAVSGWFVPFADAQDSPEAAIKMLEAAAKAAGATVPSRFLRPEGPEGR